MKTHVERNKLRDNWIRFVDDNPWVYQSDVSGIKRAEVSKPVSHYGEHYMIKLRGSRARWLRVRYRQSPVDSAGFALYVKFSDGTVNILDGNVKVY